MDERRYKTRAYPVFRNTRDGPRVHRTLFASFWADRRGSVRSTNVLGNSAPLRSGYNRVEVAAVDRRLTDGRDLLVHDMYVIDGTVIEFERFRPVYRREVVGY